MKRVLNFFSLMAMGLMIAGLISVIVAGPDARLPGEGLQLGADGGAGALPDGGWALDPKSLLIGLGAGWVLALLGRVSWFELPARAAAWLIRNERNFFRFGMAGIFVAVLLFY